TTVLVAVARDGEGNEGAGYAGAPAKAVDQAGALAGLMLREGGSDLGALLGIERFEERFFGFGSGGLSEAGACAISLAGWELLGRREGLACADLWGRRGGTETLECYFSGLFLEVATEELAEEAGRLRAAGYRYVKMRPGAGLRGDLARLGEVRRI